MRRDNGTQLNKMKHPKFTLLAQLKASKTRQGRGQPKDLFFDFEDA